MKPLKPLSFACKLRLCAAILVAALATDIFDRAAYRRIWRALSLWWGAMDKGERVDEDEYDRRMNACRSCSLWFAPLQTCSSPLKKGASDLGCWCHMPTKSRLAEARCWLEESELSPPSGWRSEGALSDPPSKDSGAQDGVGDAR